MLAASMLPVHEMHHALLMVTTAFVLPGELYDLHPAFGPGQHGHQLHGSHVLLLRGISKGDARPVLWPAGCLQGAAGGHDSAFAACIKRADNFLAGIRGQCSKRSHVPDILSLCSLWCYGKRAHVTNAA